MLSIPCVFRPWVTCVDSVIFLEGCNVLPPTTSFQHSQLNDTHHGCGGPNSASSGQTSSDMNASSQATVLTKRCLNSTCAISKLPPELLSHVFSISVLCDRPGMKNGLYSLGWISVTQACHYWREVGAGFCSRFGHADWNGPRSRSQRRLSGDTLTLHICHESGVQRCCVARAIVHLRSL